MDISTTAGRKITDNDLTYPGLIVRLHPQGDSYSDDSYSDDFYTPRFLYPTIPMPASLALYQGSLF